MDCEGCWRVEVYNYVSNASFVALVDVGAGRVVEFRTQADAQPELPAELAALAARIAVASPAVAEALGFEPGLDAAGMPGVKSALEGSDCERSRHLCVAPTFRVEGRALWAIVDLTVGRVVGLRWTDLGRGETAPITEQSLQDEVVMAHYCQKVNRLERGGWTMDYLLTPSDGLEVRDLRFEGRPVLSSAKLVDWHVSYSREDGFGYSDATGCPQFSSASVVAFDGPRIESLEEERELDMDEDRGEARAEDAAEGAAEDGMGVEDEGLEAGERGFALVQDFRSEQWPMPCNYRYVQRFEFYADGSLRVGGANVGRGCGDDGTYRPVLRIQPAGAGFERLERLETEGGWQPVDEEGYWKLEALALDEAGRTLRWVDSGGEGYAMQPGLDDGGWVYVTASKAEEGEGDLLTIGSCCNSDHRQGPEKFIEPEGMGAGEEPVIWVVAELENDDRPGRERCWVETVLEGGLPRNVEYPCYFGPRFEPLR